MSDEVNTDPVVEPEVKPELSLQAEETSPAPDQPLETKAEDEVPALAPGGERFKQVWARAKTAESERDSLREENQREREQRIRLEERLKAQEETKVASQPEYSWDQLEGMIAEGKITRASAADYRENLVADKARKEAVKELETRLSTTSKESQVLGEIHRYKTAMPEILQTGTPERQKVEREYAYMVNTLGFPPTHATELAATRAALGDLDTVERSVQAKRSAQKESFMETHSSTQKPQQKTNDPITKLDQRQKEHYEKMIRAGRYEGWDDVREELNYVRPKRTVRG
jgi:hypothetical protein